MRRVSSRWWRLLSKWYEGANEASFKAVAEGYVFQSPNPWIFTRPRYYLVNEVQKTEIAAHLRRWRLLTLALVVIILPIEVALTAWMTLAPSTFPRLFQSAFLQFGVGFVLLVTPLVAMQHIYLTRALRPLLAGAPRTNERINFSEQLRKTAAAMPGWVLAIGLVGGVGMIAGAALMLLEPFFECHLARSLLLYSTLLVLGALLTAYFVHLVKLKAKAQT